MSSAQTNEKGGVIRFAWKSEWITPGLRTVVGSIVLEWAMLDAETTRLCEIFWIHHHPQDALPRPFDRRVRILRDFAANIYAQEPAEFLTFAWFLQRLKTANGHRDHIAHGLPGRITRHGREFAGLLVPHPSSDDRYIPMTLKGIRSLYEEICSLHREASAIAYPLYAAQHYALFGKPVRQVENGSMPATVHSRSPMLPRFSTPPATFRP